MRPLAAGKLTVVLLSLNAVALLLLAVAVFSRVEVSHAAWAQQPPAGFDHAVARMSAASGSYLIVPAQFAPNMWGCYVLDANTQTLGVYVYSPGERLLHLRAARLISHDLALRSFNTEPDPAEIARLVQKQLEFQTGGALAPEPAAPPADGTKQDQVENDRRGAEPAAE